MSIKLPKRPRDPAQIAKLIVDITTGEVEDNLPKAETAENRSAINAGRRGGLARAKSMSPERKSQIGKSGAKARWEGHPARVEEE